MSRATAARRVAQQLPAFSSSAFVSAVARIADALQTCRPHERVIQRGDDRPGVACIQAKIGDVPHLVFVRGPRDRDRGHDDRMLYLASEFRRHNAAHASSSDASDSARLNVFLCHASHDKESVRQLYDSLKHLPIDLWLDELRLLPGADWEREIRHALRAAHIVLVCLSTAAVTREGFVQKEIRIALDIADEKPDGSIFVIPARFSECDVPDRLRRWQWVDLYHSHGIPRLVAALGERARSLGLSWSS
jgi:hypothetical protein